MPSLTSVVTCAFKEPIFVPFGILPVAQAILVFSPILTPGPIRVIN